MINWEEFDNRPRECWICGTTYQKVKEIDFGETYLDGIPKNNTDIYFYNLYEKCPHCHYVSETINRPNITKDASAVTLAKMSEEYQSILNNQKISETEKKLLLKECLVKKRVESEDNIYFHLYAFYDIEKQPEKAKKYALIMIEKLEKHIEINNQIYKDDETKLSASKSTSCKLMELYRRQKMFDKTIEIYIKYKKFHFDKDEQSYKNYFKKQYQLCKKKISDRA